jgi:hypothetical protein
MPLSWPSIRDAWLCGLRRRSFAEFLQVDRLKHFCQSLLLRQVKRPEFARG